MDYIIIIVLVVLNIILAMIFCESCFTPAGLNTLVWSFFIVISINLNMDFYNDYSGIYWIIVSMTAMIAGETLGMRIKYRVSPVLPVQSRYFDRSWRLLKLFILLGFLKILMEIYKNGFSLASFFNIESFFNMNQSMAYARYSGTGSYYNIFLQLLNVFCYVAPLCGGYLFFYAKNRKEILWSFVSFLPMLLSVFFTNAKSGFIADVFLWIAGYIISSLRKNHRPPSVNKKFIAYGATGILGFFGITFLSMVIRIGEFSWKIFDIVWNKYMLYAFGHMQAFNRWYVVGTEKLQINLGKGTFLGVSDLIGIAEKEAGVYDFISGTVSNVFTAFRGVIEDFGKSGGLLFILLTGILGGYLYANVRSNRPASCLQMSLLVAVYLWILYGMIISPWTYMSIVLVFPVFIIFLMASNVKVGKHTMGG